MSTAERKSASKGLGIIEARIICLFFIFRLYGLPTGSNYSACPQSCYKVVVDEKLSDLFL